MLRIFVSSTYDDLKSYREEVRKLIYALGFIDIAMEKWSARPNPPIDEVDRALSETDVYVGIFAWRYGSKIPGKDISYTEYEYRFAKENGIPRLVFLLSPEKPHPPKLIDFGPDGEAIHSLRREIEGETGIVWTYFDTGMDLVRKLSASLFRLASDSSKLSYLLDEGQRYVLMLRQLTNLDFIRRRNELENQSYESGREWFISHMNLCNVGDNYIPRPNVRREIANWLYSSQKQYLFLTGEAGIGKTNLLIVEVVLNIVGQSRYGQKPGAVLFLPLGAYNPQHSFETNLKQVTNHPEMQLPSINLRKLIGSGDIMLILDGLDEFLRINGEDAYDDFAQSLHEYVRSERARIIISCRDHAYRRLKTRGIFGAQKDGERIRVPQLTIEEAVEAVRNRLGDDSAAYFALTNRRALAGFARNPLVLEIMCRVSRESWKKLVESQTMGRLFDLWFEEIIAASASKPEEILQDEYIEFTRVKVGEIATLMLENRSDLVSEAELLRKDLDLDALKVLTRKPFGIFTQQTVNEWGFVHDSFREFSLARTLATELTSRQYNLLAGGLRFDYFGAETYAFLKDLLTNQGFDRAVEVAIDGIMTNREQWNNMVRNCFEAIGTVSPESERKNRYIEKGLQILCPDDAEDLAWYKTKYNIVRCLERLHKSGPKPYYEYVLTKGWSDKPSWNCYGALAIRGTNKEYPQPGFMPPMFYNGHQNTSDDHLQEKVSDCLLRLVERPTSERPGEQREQESYLKVNCTFALIRWLHENHIPRVKALLKNGDLGPGLKGNLFQAFLRFRKPEILKNCTELFEGMEICWVYITQDMFPRDFVFRGVLFHRYNDSFIEGFPPSAFEYCRRE